MQMNNILYLVLTRHSRYNTNSAWSFDFDYMEIIITIYVFGSLATSL
jgi:hypothetical protein